MTNTLQKEKIKKLLPEFPFYLTIGLKRAFVLKDTKSDSCSPILSDYLPTYSSKAGLLINNFINDIKSSSYLHHPLVKREFCDQFCRGSAGLFYNKKYPHPLSSTRILGGSSSGAAFNLLARETEISICSDTGGSARFPVLCSKNQLVGFKPSYNLISKEGLIQYVGDFDTVALMTTKKNTHLLPIFLDILTEGNVPKYDLSFFKIIRETDSDFQTIGLKELYDKRDRRDQKLLSMYYKTKSTLYCWSNLQRYDGRRFTQYDKTYPLEFKPNPQFLKGGEIERISKLSKMEIEELVRELKRIEKPAQKIISQIKNIFNTNKVFLLRRFEGVFTSQGMSDGMSDDEGLDLYIENLTGLPSIMLSAGEQKYISITGPFGSDICLADPLILNKITSQFIKLAEKETAEK